MQRASRLRERLEKLYATYGAAETRTDPIRFARGQKRDDDRETVAFIASALAYGRQDHIGRSVERILALLGRRPAAALRALDPLRAARDLAGFSHRFNTGEDVALLLTILGRLLDRHGSLYGAFLEGWDPSQENVGPALAAFTRKALEVDVHPLTRDGKIPGGAGVRFFFSSPEDGSACKRLNMFLRWMVRKDDVDMGLWGEIPPSKLIVPLDTHVAAASRKLGLSRRRSADWRMALEVTESLRRVDPADPVRYDFALFNWGLRGHARQAAG